MCGVVPPRLDFFHARAATSFFSKPDQSWPPILNSFLPSAVISPTITPSPTRISQQFSFLHLPQQYVKGFFFVARLYRPVHGSEIGVPWSRGEINCRQIDLTPNCVSWGSTLFSTHASFLCGWGLCSRNWIPIQNPCYGGGLSPEFVGATGGSLERHLGGVKRDLVSIDTVGGTFYTSGSCMFVIPELEMWLVCSPAVSPLWNKMLIMRSRVNLVCWAAVYRALINLEA